MNRDENSAEDPAGRCASCGANLPPNTRFCPECGAEAASGATCPSCGETVNSGERFCRYCGTQVTAFMSGRSPEAAIPNPTAETPQEESGTGPTEAGASPPPPEDDLRRASQRPSPTYRSFDPSAITCPRCGAQASAYDSFCNSCGLPFDEPETTREGGFADVVYAGLLVRLVARLIDAFILFAIFIVFFFIAGTDSFFVTEDEVPYPTNTFYLVAIAIQYAYHVGFVALWKATPGKRVMGLRVEPAVGTFLGIARPAIREGVIQAPSLLSFTPYDETGGIVTLVFIFASVFVALSRPDRRMIHDLVAGTMVVRERT